MLRLLSLHFSLVSYYMHLFTLSISWVSWDIPWPFWDICTIAIPRPSRSTHPTHYRIHRHSLRPPSLHHIDVCCISIAGTPYQQPNAQLHPSVLIGVGAGSISILASLDLFAVGSFDTGSPFLTIISLPRNRMCSGRSKNGCLCTIFFLGRLCLFPSSSTPSTCVVDSGSETS